MMNAESVHPTGYPPPAAPSDTVRVGGASRFDQKKSVVKGGLPKVVRLGGTFDPPLSSPEKVGIKINNPTGKYPHTTEHIL